MLLQRVIPATHRTRTCARIAALVLAGVMATTSALAEKPDDTGKGKGSGKEEPARVQLPDKRVAVPAGGYFEDRQRIAARAYYAEQFSKGRCPPGLAKKNNGCLPPGQARKWAVGQPLPREVVFYTVPPAVVVQLGAPPAGHRYVRVATDILLIAIGTAMVIDAIEDLGGM